MKCKILIFIFLTVLSCSIQTGNDNEKIISYVVDPELQDIRFYWKDEKGRIFGSIRELKKWTNEKGLKLAFAMNGGMFMKDQTPLGLYIENGETLRKLNTSSGRGNFYIRPNGIFYITKSNQAGICKTSEFINNGLIKYATQSGPMLVIDGKINSVFKKNSTSRNIRNGVGILPGNKIICAISKGKINFYEFALFFEKSGCKDAMYLDGIISQAYMPENKVRQKGGKFGVIIGVITSE
jgi:uncharacterized protein YigE (DUF2233 family)